MRNLFTLLLLTLVVGFAVFQYGGVTSREWNIALIALCIVSLCVWLPGKAAAFAPPLSAASLILMAAIPGYVALQLLPMPPGLLAVLSPNGYEILRALGPGHIGQWAALSLAPQLTFAQLLRLLAYGLVFLVARELTFRFAHRASLGAIPLLVVGLFESFIGLAQHFGGGGSATGTYMHHGHLAGLLEMVLPLSLAFIAIAFHQRGDRIRRSLGGAALVFVTIAIAVAILLGLLYTASRMSLAAAAISIVILGASALSSRRNRNNAMLFIAAASLVLLLLSAPLSLLGRYEDGLTSEIRFHIWRDTLTLIAKYPVFGCGLGTYVSGIQKYLSVVPGGLVDYAHNDYLQLLAELGVVGFLCLASFAVVFIRDTYGNLSVETGVQVRVLVMGCAASLAAIAIHSVVDFQFYIPANTMVAAWIAGIASGVAVRRRDGGSIEHGQCP